MEYIGGVYHGVVVREKEFCVENASFVGCVTRSLDFNVEVFEIVGIGLYINSLNLLLVQLLSLLDDARRRLCHCCCRI
jgi:hypothetical protein